MLLKRMYNKIKNIEDKIPDITNLPSKTTLNAKINKIKGENWVLSTQLGILLLIQNQVRWKVKYLILLTWLLLVLLLLLEIK